MADEAQPKYQELDYHKNLKARYDAEAGVAEEEVDLGRDFSGGRSADELDGFVGVDPIYRNYANDVDRPLFSEGDGPQAIMEDKLTDASDAFLNGGEGITANALGNTTVPDANATPEEKVEVQEEESSDKKAPKKATSTKTAAKS